MCRQPFFTDPKSLAATWKALRSDEPPKVDFSKEFVILEIAGGRNTPRVSVSLQDGNMRWGSFSTRVGGSGFGYTFVIVSRDGVETVQGKPIPKPPGPMPDPADS